MEVTSLRLPRPRGCEFAAANMPQIHSKKHPLAQRPIGLLGSNDCNKNRVLEPEGLILEVLLMLRVRPLIELHSKVEGLDSLDPSGRVSGQGLQYRPQVEGLLLEGPQKKSPNL